MPEKDTLMQSFDNAKAIARAPRVATDPQLINLLHDRVRDWTALGLLDMTHLVLIEVGDTDASIIEELAFPPRSIRSTVCASGWKGSSCRSTTPKITAATSN